MARVCIFCGGRPLTLEHVFAQWLSPVLIPPNKAIYMDLETFHKGTSTKHPRREPPDIDLQIRRVCGPCNNGWMARLEGQVGPILEGIHTGSIHMIDGAAQTSLASWAAKTAVTIEYVNPQPNVPKNRCEWMFEHHTPPPDTMIWLARYDGPRVVSVISQYLIFNHPDVNVDNRIYGQVVNFIIGSMLFVVLAVYLKDTRVIVKLPRYLGDNLFRLSPRGTPIVWPNHGFSDSIRQRLIDTDWSQALTLTISR